MISKRFNHNKQPSVEMNELQLSSRDQVEAKREQGVYELESIPCCVCNSSDFELLANQDKYGLYMSVVICRQCGLIQTNPRMNQKSYGQFYEQEYFPLLKGGRYDGSDKPREADFQAQYRRAKGYYRFICDALKRDLEGLFVLEVGCGTGGALQYFMEMGCRVKGIDTAVEYPAYGREKYGLNISSTDLSHLSLSEAPDIVIYSHSFEHLLDPVGELRILPSIMKPDGYICIVVPGVKAIVRRSTVDFMLFLQLAHTYHFSLTSLTNLMMKGNFVLVNGNERVYGLFKKSSVELNTPYKNDYGAIRLLKWSEYLRPVMLKSPRWVSNLIRDFLRRSLANPKYNI